MDGLKDILPNELARRVMKKLHDHGLLDDLPDERVGRIGDCIELTLFRNAAAARPAAEGGGDG